jgi:hypothetical protein
MISWFENLGGPTGLVLLGAIFSAIGAFWASRQQDHKSNEISRLNEKIAGQQEQLIRKSDELATNITRLVTQLEREGKITKQEADRILKQYLADSVAIQENLEVEVIRTPARQP